MPSPSQLGPRDFGVELLLPSSQNSNVIDLVVIHSSAWEHASTTRHNQHADDRKVLDRHNQPEEVGISNSRPHEPLIAPTRLVWAHHRTSGSNTEFLSSFRGTTHGKRMACLLGTRSSRPRLFMKIPAHTQPQLPPSQEHDSLMQPGAVRDQLHVQISGHMGALGHPSRHIYCPN